MPHQQTHNPDHRQQFTVGSYKNVSNNSPDLDSLISADVLALGFTKSGDNPVEFIGNSRLISALEKYFEISLIDEVTFFQPSIASDL